MPPAIGFSHLFSYWLLAWAAAYYLVFVVLETDSGLRAALNPFPALALGLAENAVMAAILLARRGARAAAVLLLCALATKGTLLCLLLREPVALPESLALSLALFGAYNAYLACAGTSVLSVYSRTSASLLAGRHDTPLYALAARLT